MVLLFIYSIEAICAVAGVFYLHKQKDFWRGFIFFLPYVFLTELAGYYISYRFHTSNHWLFNIYMIVQLVFTGYILFRLFPYPRKRKWFIAGLIIFLIVYTWESFWGGYSYNGISDTISSFMMVVACGFYYYFMLDQDEYEDLSKNAAFWFVTGVFLFNFGITATNLFTEEMMHLYLTKSLSLRTAIMTALTFILDGCWIYSFRCKNRETISS